MNMRGLLVLLLFIATAALAGHFAAAKDREESSDILLSDFKEKFPEAVEDGESYLLKLDGCRIVAVSTPYSSGRIEMIFVNASKKAAAQKVAQHLAEELSSKCRVVPFEGGDPWAAIICPATNYSRRHAPSLILYPDKGRSVRFVGWQGKLLRAQMDYSSTDYMRKKCRGVIEILLDVTTSSLDHVEFRIARGRLENVDVIDFLDSRFYNSSSYLPEFSSREKSELKTKFPGCELIVYSTSSNFCIANKKGKTYHAGSIQGVSSYLRSRHPIAKFDFPKENMDWPDARIAQNKTTDSGTAMGSESKESSSQETSSAVASAQPAPSTSDSGETTAMGAVATTVNGSASTGGTGNATTNATDPSESRLNVDIEVAQYVKMLQSF